jgi:PH (Pleckstrin Homology) domain-containing protein
MPSASPVRVYKPDGWGVGGPLLAVLVLVLPGIGFLFGTAALGWIGLLPAAAFLVPAALWVLALTRISLTAHEQGIVIREYLGRDFIPWEVVTEIRNERRRGDSRDKVYLYLYGKGSGRPTYKELSATAGSPGRAAAIAAELQELRQRDHDARAAAAEYAPASLLPAPVTPIAPADDRDDDREYGPSLGKALW